MKPSDCKGCPKCRGQMTRQDAARFGCCWGCVKPERLGGDWVVFVVLSRQALPQGCQAVGPR